MDQMASRSGSAVRFEATIALLHGGDIETYVRGPQGGAIEDRRQNRGSSSSVPQHAIICMGS